MSCIGLVILAGGPWKAGREVADVDVRYRRFCVTGTWAPPVSGAGDLAGGPVDTWIFRSGVPTTCAKEMMARCGEPNACGVGPTNQIVLE